MSFVFCVIELMGKGTVNWLIVSEQ